MPDYSALIAPDNQPTQQADYSALTAPSQEAKSPLPDWAAKLHKAIDPVEAFGGVLPLLAMAIPAGVGGVMPSMAARPVPPSVIPNTAANTTAQAAGRIGVELPNVALRGPVQQNIAAKLSDIPVVGAPIEQAATKAINQVGQAATNVEKGFGGASVPEAGAGARDSLTNYIQGTVRANKDKLYGAVDALVPQDVPTALNATRAKIAAIDAKRAQAALPQSKASSIVEEALSRPEGLTYPGIKQLRTSVGEMLDTGILPAEISKAELKQLYAGLTDDLKTSVSAGGPRALAAFEKANNYTKLAADRSENLMRILGAKSDEGVVDRIVAAAGSTSRADINLLGQARKSMDAGAWDGVASAVVSRLGRDPSGAFSAERFLTAWGKLTPAAKNVLFKSTGKPDLAQALDDIATVSAKFKQLHGYANTSKTGASVATIGGLTGLMSAPLVTIAAGIGGRVLAHLLAKPATAKAVAAYSRAALSGPQKAALAAKPLAIVIAKELGVSADLIPRIMAEIQGTGTSNAQDEPDQIP